jgi:predicted Rossmann fold flavoprotein
LTQQIVIIGGGASGFFSAINIALQQKQANITILEKTNKLLSKVKVSGGGRCNVTHHCLDNNELITNYPRGNKELKQIFTQFNVEDTINWFKANGLDLKIEEDGRMFPITDNSETVINCFLSLAKTLNVNILTQCEVFAIEQTQNGFKLKTSKDYIVANSIICSIGGHNKLGHYHFLKNLGHTIDEPLPSLFTFNLPNEAIKKELQGVSVKQAEVKIDTTKLSYTGPVLITHWGLSGPAVLKLSAFAAKVFYDLNYNANIQVNWVYPLKVSEVEMELKSIQKTKHKAIPLTQTHFNLPKRLWEYICNKATITNTKPWAELSNKQINKLAEVLCKDTYSMQGKTTFKEEFVTCGGINLKEIDFKTMQSKLIPNLYFCGEVINVDGITGGFNFQNAWSTAWVCATNFTS